MFGACFEGYIVNRYGFANVPGSGFIYIHCDLADPPKYLTITLIIGSNFVFIFSPCLNVGSLISLFNFGVTFINMFEGGNWEFVLRIGATIVIQHTFSCMPTFCPHTFNPRFYAKGKFGGVRNHGINGH